MPGNTEYIEMFDKLRCCVIIPAYNNAGTLGKVISETLAFTRNIIVVNDGSTDGTKKILEGFTGIHSIHFEKNQGKGYALRKAIKYAYGHDFDYGISMDADGQHLPSDLPLFLEKITENPEAVIVGSRNMKQEGIPGASSFGNSFSNFWFYIDTGVKLPDTQSGFRSYPLFLLHNKRFFGRKYEFEVEVLVRSAWKRIAVIPMPVSVYYPPKNERVSHFRPFADFLRITLLNIVLFILAVLIFRPFGFISLLNKKNVKEFFQKNIIQNTDSDAKITFSVMLGVFIGVAPIWGWQMVVAVLLAMLFRLNKLITLVASNISLTPNIPLIIYLSYVFGGWVIPHNAVDIPYSSQISLATIKINIIQYLLGSVTFGVFIALVAGLVTLIILKIARRKKRRNNNVVANSEQ